MEAPLKKQYISGSRRKSKGINMVYIFAAHKGEVENILKKLSLGKRKTSFPFLQYEGEEILLTITGQGQVNAAASVSATLQEEKAKKGDILLSLGTAAVIMPKEQFGQEGKALFVKEKAKASTSRKSLSLFQEGKESLLDNEKLSEGGEELLGRWFWIQKLEQESTGRNFYPDLLYKLDFPEASLLTGDRILEFHAHKGGSGANVYTDSPLLYDMESAAVFQAANYYLAPEDFFFLRCVTDFGIAPVEKKGQFSKSENQPFDETNSASMDWKEKMQNLLQREEEKILSFIGELRERAKERREEEEKEEGFQKQLQCLSENLHCSFVMEKQLERLLRYAGLQGIFPEEVQGFLQENFGGEDGSISLTDKRAGKKVLSSLKQWILSPRENAVKDIAGLGNPPGREKVAKDVHSLENPGELTYPFPDEKGTKKNRYQEHFQHIYVEEALLQSPEVKGILQKFPKAKVIPIKHYKDLFNRKKQGRLPQSRSRKLILARKEGQRLYDGAVVCQDFSKSHFCYTSLLMNCPFHCAYCYLQGMYPSSNLVMFLNLEDYFSDCRKWIAEKGSLYLCISYDSDMLAMEGIYPYVEEFARFLNQENALRIEVRTKAGGEGLWRKMQKLPLSVEGRKRMIFAFTLSPEEIIEEAEEGTARLSSRIFAIQKALEEGYLVRLCFDPMIYHPRWKALYSALLQEVFEKIPMEQIHDCSLGSFRISESYLKAMGKALPNSPHTQFPYENSGGYYHYPGELMEEMEGFLYSRLQERLPKEKIFRWDSQGVDGVNEE